MEKTIYAILSVLVQLVVVGVAVWYAVKMAKHEL